jgi:hypothetical protein
MHLRRLLVLSGLALGLGNACGSVLPTNDGGGETGGATGGHGGAAGGKGSTGGAGGSGGVSCGDLATQYADALPTAQSCSLTALISSGECQQLVSSSLSPCFLNCMTYVNDPTALNAIKASWEQAGCDNVDVLCPAIECLQPTNNACLVGDGGAGVCSSNGGGNGGQGGHAGTAGGMGGSVGSAGAGGHAGISGGAGSGGAGAGGSGVGGGAGTGGVSGYCNSDSDCTWRTTGCCEETCMAATAPVPTGTVTCNIACVAPGTCGCVNHQCAQETGAGGQGGAGGSAGGSGIGGQGGGESCAQLTTDYSNALPAAASCTPGAANQCQQQALFPTCTSCYDSVNDATTLDSIRSQLIAQGCTHPVACPCAFPGQVTCVANDGGSGAGTCTASVN